jgi:RNA polymerase sigma factor (sigma-70 family)
LTEHDEDLARRVYSYFIFRLRQPDDAERLTRVCFERYWRDANLNPDTEQEPDMPVFATARVVLAENPRARGATRVAPTGRGDESRGLSDELLMAIGRLHGRERDALALRFGAELSVGEIAELLDRTPADVKQRLARGIRGLRDLGVSPPAAKPGGSAERPGPGGAEQGETQQRQSRD